MARRPSLPVSRPCDKTDAPHNGPTGMPKRSASESPKPRPNDGSGVAVRPKPTDLRAVKSRPGLASTPWLAGLRRCCAVACVLSAGSRDDVRLPGRRGCSFGAKGGICSSSSARGRPNGVNDSSRWRNAGPLITCTAEGRPGAVCTHSSLQHGAQPLPHLYPDCARPSPHAHRDWVHHRHICTATGPSRATASPGLGAASRVRMCQGEPISRIGSGGSHALLLSRRRCGRERVPLRS